MFSAAPNVASESMSVIEGRVARIAGVLTHRSLVFLSHSRKRLSLQGRSRSRSSVMRVIARSCVSSADASAAAAGRSLVHCSKVYSVQMAHRILSNNGPRDSTITEGERVAPVTGRQLKFVLIDSQAPLRAHNSLYVIAFVARFLDSTWL